MNRLRLALLFPILLPLPLAAQGAPRFQQGVEYQIEATLDPISEVLRGRAQLRYTNRSGTALDTLYLHQHLNAFRPNSAWARRELQFGNRRFQDLGPEQHGFERLTAVRVGDAPVRPVYPGAPDSTVVAIPLPAPLAPGASATVLLDWDARLATVSRRQGRRDRHYDWAHWYPRIAVFDRGGWQHHALYPQGEFYGEFARYDVTLEVAEDQVIGATGVPVEGDPGWSRAAVAPVPESQFRRDAYPATPATPLGLLVDRPAAGRKRIRWRADDVHHFAWASDPDFTHDAAQYTRAGADPVAIHLLAQPGDSAWNRPVALQRTVDALRWLEGLFGPYPYPQLTNLHRLDTGGTEFPMMIMDYTDSEGLIVHEVTHQWLHGILANNEWRDGWLDEGFTSFVTNWYWEEHGQPDVWDRTIEAVAARERAGRTEPIATPGPGFSDFPTYSAMTYSKASLVFRMLRNLLGEDAFRRGLHLYSERHRFQHVDEADLRAAMEEAGGQDLGWFFRQWLHTTDTLDYGIGDLRVERAPGGWRTEVEVLRLGKAWMPVTLQVGDATRRLAGREQRQVVSVTTRTRPSEAVLDPRGVLLDLDPTNQRKAIP